MTGASGLQIAFLILAVEFFSMLLGRQTARWMGSSGQVPELLGQAIAFLVGAAILFGVRPLRRFCLDSLANPIPRSMRSELLLVTLGKCAIPFAMLGAYAGWQLVTGEPDRISHPLGWVDPQRGWTFTLSPTGLVKMVLLSWLVGPVVEELVFRGLLYRTWERQRGWFASMLLTSACFGLAHPSNVVATFLGSIVYISVLRRTGSLRASILMHIVFNILFSWPLLGRAFRDPPAGDFASPWTWALPLACLAFVMVALPAYVWTSRHEPLVAPRAS